MILYLNTWLQSDAQVPYEDIRYEYEEWPQIKHSRRFTVFMHYVLKEKNLKKKLNILFLFICILTTEMPYGQLPVLEYKGQMLPQV